MKLTEPRPNIRAVYFDAVGTLIHPDPPAEVIYAEVGHRHGSCRSPQEIHRRFRDAWQAEEAADRAAQWRTSETREQQRWRRIVTTTLDDATDPEACFQELFAHFRQPTAWRWDPDARPVLAELAGRGLLVGIASNFDRRLRDVLAGAPATKSVQRIIISSEVGWRKPSQLFFDALWQQAGCTREQTLYVGDDPDNDLEGATHAGLQAMLLVPAAKIRKNEAKTPDFMAPKGGAAVFSEEEVYITRLTKLVTILSDLIWKV